MVSPGEQRIAVALAAGRERERPGAIGLGLADLVAQALRRLRERMLRRRRDLVEGALRDRKIAEEGLREARVVARLQPERGVERDRAVEMRRGLGVGAGAVGRDPREQVGARVVGTRRQHAIEGRARLGGETGLQLQHAEVDQQIRIVGIERETALDQLAGAGGVPLLLGDQRQIVNRDGVVGIELEHLLEERARLVETLLAVGDHAAVEGELGLDRGERGSGQQAAEQRGEPRPAPHGAPDREVETHLASLPRRRPPKAGH